MNFKNFLDNFLEQKRFCKKTSLILNYLSRKFGHKKMKVDEIR